MSSKPRFMRNVCRRDMRGESDMRTFRETICGPCGGKLYPRQCRNSHVWRAFKVDAYDDIDDVSFSCPFGVPLDFLPRLEGRPERTPPPPLPDPPCRWAVFLQRTCCALNYRCTRLACRHHGKPVTPNLCARCKHRKP